ncbi:hypothetical protein LMG24235_05101 [Paraburkholderia sabiae]|nr:hypothetical protein LMG24235_05101 [Paraburkholderia sabiae]
MRSLHAIKLPSLGHVFMALKLHFVDGNESLRAMLPQWVAQLIGEKRAGRSLST